MKSKQRVSLVVIRLHVMKQWNLLPQEVMGATCVNQIKNRLYKFWQRY